MTTPLHVAVGVIKNQQGEILISQRNKAVHQGGLWEFPGGKLETGETVRQALSRELLEELNLTVNQAEPLIKIKHQYPDIQVLLDVWYITDFTGPIESLEGQIWKWETIENLHRLPFPAANIPIISAAKLPRCYAILNGGKTTDLRRKLLQILNENIKLIQIRVKPLSQIEVDELISFALPLCKKNQAVLIVNSEVQNAWRLPVDGIHLTSKDLLALKNKPAGYKWVAASCHTQEELKHAEQLGIDFVVLAPVSETSTHPQVRGIGWQRFAEMVAEIRIPVFALGGMQQTDLEVAIRAGAQGIAGISAFSQ